MPPFYDPYFKIGTILISPPPIDIADCSAINYRGKPNVTVGFVTRTRRESQNSICSNVSCKVKGARATGVGCSALEGPSRAAFDDRWPSCEVVNKTVVIA